jgi:hypothetical protein
LPESGSIIDRECLFGPLRRTSEMNRPIRTGQFASTVLGLLLLISIGMAQGPMNEQPDMTIDSAARNQVIDVLMKALRDRYIFPEVAGQIEQSIRKRLQDNEYDKLTSAMAFSKTLTEHLREVSHDKHLGVNYSYRPLPEGPGGPGPGPGGPGGRNPMAAINFGFEKVERLPGNLGYLKFNGFVDPQSGGGEVAASAMNFLNNTDALIIDLRENGGGSPGMVALVCSYLFDGPQVHLNDLFWRLVPWDGGRDVTVQSWTLPYVPGKRYVNKDVYILTSKRTFSAAEEFTYNLKTLKRAIIVGETTGGGANPGGGVRLGEHFIAFVPSGRAINPITKTNWEGTGIAPDIEAPAAQALETAEITALKKLQERNTDERLGSEIKRAIENVQKELDRLGGKKASPQGPGAADK